MSATTPDWRRWATDAAVGAAVALVGLLQVAWTVPFDVSASVLVALGFGAAAGTARLLPGMALALVWLSGVLQLLSGAPVLVTELAVALVAFACARWGSVAVVVLSALSIPTGTLLVVLAATTTLLEPWVSLSILDEQARQLADTAYLFGDTWEVGVVVVGTMALVAPWLLGLALRFMSRALRSEASEEVAHADAARAQREAAQAQEIARLREQQASLARDVHDVVGHSLAVILAQAESAQFLPDDPGRLKQTLATIARSARTSLGDVRQVLADPGVASVRPTWLDELVDTVRATGQEVLVCETGSPRPLPPDLAVVAHRVMQEMLTNAVKHGRRDRPVHVERHWPRGADERDLRLEVRSAMPAVRELQETQPLRRADTPPRAPVTGGSGIDGMRRRVEAVGGRLDVRRDARADGPAFTVAAWVPVRA